MALKMSVFPRAIYRNCRNCRHPIRGLGPCGLWEILNLQEQSRNGWSIEPATDTEALYHIQIAKITNRDIKLI